MTKITVDELLHVTECPIYKRPTTVLEFYLIFLDVMGLAFANIS